MVPGKNVKIGKIALSRRSFLATTGLFATASHARAARPLVVASKIDTEGALLGQLIGATLRAHGVPVEMRLQLGPTRIVRQALLSGAIDLYPEYTGNGAQFFQAAGNPVWHVAAAAFRTVHALDLARNSLVWLQPAPADNGFGIAVPHALARLATLDGLAAYLARGGRLRLAASVEFVESADALPAFERAYGFRLRQDQLLMLAGGDTAATLRAASEGLSGINAGMAYGTDGALSVLGLTLLADPNHAQIVFQPAPVIRGAALDAQPQIATWLAPLFASLTTDRLRTMNAHIAGDGADPHEVAGTYLATAGWMR